MVRLRDAALLTLMAGTLTPRPASACDQVPQAAPIPPDTLRLHALLTRMHDRGFVRIGVTNEPRIHGRYAGLVGDTIVPRTGETDHRLPVATIDSVWLRQRPIAANAVHVGLVGGLLAATLTLLGTFHFSCHGTLINPFAPPNLDCKATAGAIGRAAGLGSFAGALLGAAIGAEFPHWRLRFP